MEKGEARKENENKKEGRAVVLVGSDGEHQKRLWDRRKEKAALFLLDMHFSQLIISLKLVCVL